MSDTIAWFADIGLADRPAVGGKGGSLGELTRAGLAVPPGFVVRTEAFEAFVAALDARQTLRGEIEALDPDDLPTVQAASENVRARITGEELPGERADAIHAAYRVLGEGEPVAVRSSATTEDAEDASFAGLQDTYLWVVGADALLDAVRRCWASLYSVESVTYRRRQNFPERKVAMAVVVQRMVDASCAGVMFTRSPVSGDRSVVTIEGSWGLGSTVVSGEVTPDRWVVAKLTDEIPVRDISDKRVRDCPAPGGGVEQLPVPDSQRNLACLEDTQLLALRDIGIKAERHYGKPQDIEWAFDREGNLFLLQSRPETVWAARDAAPVATPQANPLAHLLTVFGGRR